MDWDQGKTEQWWDVRMVEGAEGKESWFYTIEIMACSHKRKTVRKWMGGVEDKDFRSKYVEFKVHVNQLVEMPHKLKAKVAIGYVLGNVLD